MEERKRLNFDFGKLAVLWDNISKSEIQNKFPKIPLAAIHHKLADFLRNINKPDYSKVKLRELAVQLDVLVKSSIFPELTELIQHLATDLKNNHGDHFKLFVVEETENGLLGSMIDILNSHRTAEKEMKQILPTFTYPGKSTTDRKQVNASDKTTDDYEETPTTTALQLYGLALRHFKAAEYQSAELTIKQSVALFGKEIKPPLLEAENLFAAILSERLKFDEARMVLSIIQDQLKKLDPKKLSEDEISELISRYHLAKSACNSQEGDSHLRHNNLVAAEQCYRESIQSDLAMIQKDVENLPGLNSMISWISLSQVYAHLTKPTQALDALKQALIIVAKFSEDKSSAAVNKFNGVISHIKKIIDEFISLGKKCKTAKDYSNAELLIDAASYGSKELMKYNPDFYETYLHAETDRVLLLGALKQHEKARDLNRELILAAEKMTDKLPAKSIERLTQWRIIADKLQILFDKNIQKNKETKLEQTSSREHKKHLLTSTSIFSSRAKKELDKLSSNDLQVLKYLANGMNSPDPAKMHNDMIDRMVGIQGRVFLKIVLHNIDIALNSKNESQIQLAKKANQFILLQATTNKALQLNLDELKKAPEFREPKGP